MKKFLAALIVSVYAFLTPVQTYAMEGMGKTFVAAFTGEEFSGQWSGKYEPDLKFIYHTWADLPKFIEQAKQQAGNRPLVIDLDVHGDEEGFYVLSTCVVSDYNEGIKETPEVNSKANPRLSYVYAYYQKASMGYIYNVLESKLKGRKNLTVLIEACYAGNAYHTIRGNTGGDPYNQNYPHYPDIACYVIGSGFTNPDISMMLQTKHNIKKYYKDIRDYETELPHSPEPQVLGYQSGTSYSTLELVFIDNLIRTFL